MICSKSRIYNSSLNSNQTFQDLKSKTNKERFLSDNAGVAKPSSTLSQTYIMNKGMTSKTEAYFGFKKYHGWDLNPYPHQSGTIYFDYLR